MTSTKFSKECNKLFGTKNLYGVLGLDPEKKDSFTEKDIKRSYYKCSLKYHPDRVQNDGTTSEEMDLATKRFQMLGKVYAILSDSEKRKLYDESGIIDEEGATDDNFDWGVSYWRTLFKKVTPEDIENFKRDYKGSQEELDDMKAHYLKYKGDMDKIYECAYCVDTEEDRERIRSLLQQMVDQGDVEHFAKFDKQETEAMKKRRLRKAKKEEAEAKQMLKELTGKEEMQEQDLRNVIAKRNADRGMSFLQQLEEKYGGTSGGKKGAAKKKRKVADE